MQIILSQILATSQVKFGLITPINFELLSTRYKFELSKSPVFSALESVHFVCVCSHVFWLAALHLKPANFIPAGVNSTHGGTLTEIS
jgi:hypothetical protein